MTAFAWLLALTISAADEPSRPLPISAHNCYPIRNVGADRLKRALALGIDNIEIDVGWDPKRKLLIVGHDASPRPVVEYPDLESYLVPALTEHFRKPRPDGAPTVLTIDWKTENPEAVECFRVFLESHQDWFSSVVKGVKDSALTVRKLTVCLTGSDRAKQLYDDGIADGGTYRAFRDRVISRSRTTPEDVRELVPESSTTYHRFLTFHWNVIEPGGPPLAGVWNEDKAARLTRLVEHCHARGFRVRFYCLNTPSKLMENPTYTFPTREAVSIRWRLASDAGVDFIASDDYDAIVDELRSHRRSSRQP